MSVLTRRLWVGVAVIAFAATALVSIARIGREIASPGTSLPRSDPAPEFREIDAWLNSAPLTVEALRGKVVLVDFWTYTCINCVRTFPGLKALYAKYRGAGLEIVGVHAPEFRFERELANVRRAVAEHGITWPVALDNSFATWRAYRNQHWPHVYLIDTRGRIRFDHIGEGGEDMVEDRIRLLLAAEGASLPPDEPIDVAGPGTVMTREVYLGYERGSLSRSLGNREGYGKDVAVDYTAPAKALVDEAGTGGVFFLTGRWLALTEFVRAEQAGARITLRFHARDVFFVAAPAGPAPAEARLFLDGAPLRETDAGTDAAEGAVRVGRQTLYHLVRLEDSAPHRLEIVADEPGLSVYTFTFG